MPEWLLSDLLTGVMWGVIAFVFCWFFDVQITRRRRGGP